MIDLIVHSYELMRQNNEENDRLFESGIHPDEYWRLKKAADSRLVDEIGDESFISFVDRLHSKIARNARYSDDFDGDDTDLYAYFSQIEKMPYLRGVFDKHFSYLIETQDAH